MPRIGRAQVIRRGDATYEPARTGGVWNRLHPDRHPQLIVQAREVEDVPAAVAYARESGLRVAVRTGGHSMCGSSFRDGSMLLDLSALRSMSVDPMRRTASVQPAVTGHDLAGALARVGLAFPVGHCGTVPAGGYLLSGGLGWNLNAWGFACFSVAGLTVVTADGQVRKVDDTENRDLFWAARGAGPGFFGAVTGFELSLQALPRVILSSTTRFPLALVDRVSRWAASIVHELDHNVEMLLRLAMTPTGPVVVVAACAFAASQEQAERMLRPLDSCPAMPSALDRQPAQPSTLEQLFEWTETQLPRGHRYLEETAWSDDSLPDLMSRLAADYAAAPSPRSIVMVSPLYGVAGGAQPDAAFSMHASTFILAYAIWESGDEGPHRDWFDRLMRSIEPQTRGRYVAETDLVWGPGGAQACYSPAAWTRLDEVREVYDPDRLFHTYLGPDDQGSAPGLG